MTAPFDGRVALVTGAGRGIGRATALQLANGGARVALVARSVDQLEETAETVRAGGGLAVVLAADLAETGSPADSVARAVEKLGPVDILINNAAVVEPAGPTLSAAPGTWSTAFAVNVGAPVQLTLAVLPSMLSEVGGGSSMCRPGSSTTPGPWWDSTPTPPPRPRSKPTPSTWPPSWPAAASRSTFTVPAPSTRPCRHGSAANRPNRSARPCTTASRPPTSRAALITPERSARSLLARLADGANGEIWSVNDA